MKRIFKSGLAVSLCIIILIGIVAVGIIFAVRRSKSASEGETASETEVVTEVQETVDSGKGGDFVYWTFDSIGTLTLKGTGAMTDYTYRDSAPWRSSSESIKKIVIEDGVTSIGGYAFYACSSLTEITIPDSVRDIGEYAFSKCDSLAGITIPDSVTGIGEYAFEYCTNLTSITIPGSVTSIGDWVFSECTNLTNITIQNGVAEIGIDAFTYCESLTSIAIPDSVTEIGSGAFYNCAVLKNITVGTGNKNYCDVDGVLFNKDKTELICYPGCKADTSYIIPDSVTSIGDRAFEECSILTDVTIPDSVTVIGKFAFLNCTALKNITVGTGNKNYCDVDGVLFNKDKTELICYPGCKVDTSYIIPDSVTSIGYGAFENCSNLTNVTIPDSVTEICYEAFCGCTGLTSITIPDSVTSVEEGAFSGCTGLTSITIPDSVYVGYSEFYGCSNITDVYYSGSEGDINIGENNEDLQNATWHYNYNG